MDSHITKPIDPNELYAALGHWLGVAPSPGSTAPNATTSAENLPDLTDLGLDTAVLGRHVPSSDRALRLLRDFAADAPQRAEALRAAAENQDLSKLGHEAHALKSAAGHIGATDLSEKAAQTELASREEDWATAMSGGQALAQALVDLGPALRARLPDTGPTDSSPADPGQARDLVTRLRPLLAEGDAQVEDLLEELEAAVGNNDRLTEQVRQVRAAFEDLELASAADYLDALEGDLPILGETS